MNVLTITNKKIIDGLIEDDKNLQRSIAAAVSKLTADIDLTAEMAAYLFTEYTAGNTLIDGEYIASVSQRLAEQGDLLNTLMSKINDVRAINNPVPIVAATNLQTLIATHGCNPATFADRYK